MHDRVLLINPNNGLNDSNFPWGVLALASYLKDNGLDNTHILDASYYSSTLFKQLLDTEIPQAAIIGISFMSPDAYFAKNLIDSIKTKNPSSIVIVGGAHPILYPEQTIQYKNIDYLAYGDGEVTLCKLAKHFIHNEGELNDVPGLMYMKDGAVVKTSEPPSIGFRDIDYSLLPDIAQNRMRKTIHVLAGRGCNYKCTFCYNSVREQRWQARSAEDIVSELEKITAKYDPDTVVFRDESFFHSKERVVKFLKLYKEKGFRFKWEATCRADRFREDYINNQMMKDIAECNCRLMGIGMESGSQRILDKLRKGTRVEQLYKVVDIIANYPSITPAYSFMIGLPGEEYSDYIKTIDLVKYICRKKNHFYVIGPYRFRVYPGGELFNDIVSNYNISLPGSFEEWSAQYSPAKEDSVFKNNSQQYPWIPAEYNDLTAYCDSLIHFGYRSLKGRSLLFKLSFLPFRIIARIRLALNFYRLFFEIRPAAWIRNRKRKKHLANNIPLD